MLRTAALVALALTFVTNAFAVDASAEARMFQLVNRDRAANGVGPLTIDPALSAIARAHSADMVQSGFFSHNSPTTGGPEERLNRSGVSWRAYAENVSYNSSVEASQASLMKSPAHRTNLLNPTYDTIGIGIVQGSNALYVTQVFIKAGRGSSRTRATPTQPPAERYPATQQPTRKRRFRIPGF